MGSFAKIQKCLTMEVIRYLWVLYLFFVYLQLEQMPPGHLALLLIVCEIVELMKVGMSVWVYIKTKIAK